MAKRNSNGLTDKWQVVLDAWLADPKRVGSTAYKKGYPKVSQRTAEVNFSELLKKTEVATYLTKMTEVATEKAGIDAAWVLKESKNLYEECRDDNDRVQACRCLEIIGKHVDVSAFKERVELSGGVNLTGKSDKELQDIINGSKG